VGKPLPSALVMALYVGKRCSSNAKEIRRKPDACVASFWSEGTKRNNLEKKISLTGGGVRMKVPFFDAHKSLWHCSLVTLKTIKINYNGIFFAFNLLVLS
jgi:hypothetical protein